MRDEDYLLRSIHCIEVVGSRTDSVQPYSSIVQAKAQQLQDPKEVRSSGQWNFETGPELKMPVSGRYF